ncbi:hypothetical protein [Natrinema hispanicum]|uniref:DUF7260 domain-containing protein n=1 Tax=Natrinema hispanicum TaxID=392421 RepID=A0A1G6RWR8_9EURY|nr:hypothetical protein [Natrinema hispanicum]SDD09008.1 hypothetical protein SAMN05192552_101260 [Natrinema hispanicum]SET77458.1 hypothetical protein SAMN04488694_11263 [Natrinema hispanicum]
MTGATTAHRALECLAEEWETLADRDAALEAFADRVRAVPAAQPTALQAQQAAAPMATQAIQGRGATPSASDDHCASVRTAFDETVRQHSSGCEDESRFEAMATTLTEDVAGALATDTGWTPPLKAAVLEPVSTSRRELAARREIVREERSTLETAIAEIDEIVGWLQMTVDESFLQCGFDDLRAKHERLETYQDRLKTCLSRRQAQLTGSTPRDEPSGPQYRSVIESIYASGPARYPLLSTATQLYGICGDCQRTVRAHLTRRV